MKKLVIMLFVFAAMSSSVYAGVDFDQQNWELDMVSAADSDC